MSIFNHKFSSVWSESVTIRTALRYMGVYLLLGAVWIVLFHLIVNNIHEQITPLHHFYWEELSFIFIIGILLFLFLHKVVRAATDSGEALKKEQDLVDSIIETSPIGITAVDRSGRIIFANTRAEQVLGLTTEGIVSRTYNDPGWHITDLAGKPLPEEELPFMQVLRFGKPVFDRKHAIEWPNGHRVALSINGSPLFNERGEIDRVIFAIEDITAQKEAEQRLRNTTEHLHALIEASPLAIAMMTPDGKVDSVWNQAAEQMFGHTREEVEGRPFLEIPNKWQPEYQAILKKVLQGESFTGIELPHLTPSGTPLEIGIHIAPVRNDTDRIVNVMAVFEDVTKLKKTDRELLLQGSALQAAANGILITDTNGTIQWANKAMTHLTGYTLAEMKGNTPRIWRSGRQDMEFYHTLWQTILQGNVWRGELINTRKDGTTYFEEMTITPVKDKQGVITNFIAIKQNVSQRKQYLFQIEQSQKQLRALTSHLQRIRENERARIARELHDEFGQQITALKLTLELIRQKMQNALPKKTAQSVNRDIESMGIHIDEILEEVKELVAWLRPKALDNLGLVSAIEWHLQEFHNRTGIRYTLEIDDNLPALNQVQDVAIFRIVQESLTNVSRHAEASKVWVTLDMQEAQLYLTVRDNGIGMDPDRRDRPNSFGILGMRERAADFGGHLSIVSEPDSGTEVILKLPIE